MRIPQQVNDRVKEAPAQALRAVFAGIGQVLLVADRIKSRAAEANRARPDTAAPPARPSPAPAPAPAPNGAASAPDKTVPDKTLRDKTVPDETAPDKTVPDKTVPDKTVLDKTVLDKTVPDETVPDKTVPDKTVPDKTVPDKTRWRSLDETGNVRLLSDKDAAEDELADAPAAAEPAVAQATPAEAVAAEPAVAEQPAPAEPAPAAEPAAAAASVLPVPNYDGLTVASLRARLRNLDPPQLRVLIDYEKAHAGRSDVLAMFERRIAKLESGEA
jgi:hypothetical protein